MTPPLIDLYSDTKTLPTPAMREAMARAEVGDEQADEDPTTLRLCERTAALLGQEAAVFMPSGTMCNLVAILAQTRPGDEVICDHQSHIYGTEAASAAAIAGVSIAAIASPHGVFEPAQVQAALREPGRTAPRSALLAVEQTTNFSGGAVWPLDQLQAVRELAQERGLACHMDGARLLNASAATGIAPAIYARGWDSVWIDLSKGLGCPVGAVLCGNAAFVDAAWQWKYRLGGAMRQSGVLAAAGLHALDHHVAGLATDHANAQAMWRALASSEAIRFDPVRPESNILRFTFRDPALKATEFARRCLAERVRVRAIGGNFIRVTTHLGVSTDDATQAAAAMLSVVADMAR